MKLTREEVKQVALLAHLAIQEEEIDELMDEFNEVLKFVETIEQIDTENVEPTFYLLPLQNIWRTDETRKTLAQEDVFANTPDHDRSFFKVPRIL